MRKKAWKNNAKWNLFHLYLCLFLWIAQSLRSLYKAKENMLSNSQCNWRTARFVLAWPTSDFRNCPWSREGLFWSFRFIIQIRGLCLWCQMLVLYYQFETKWIMITSAADGIASLGAMCIHLIGRRGCWKFKHHNQCSEFEQILPDD